MDANRAFYEFEEDDNMYYCLKEYYESLKTKTVAVVKRESLQIQPMKAF